MPLLELNNSDFNHLNLFVRGILNKNVGMFEFYEITLTIIKYNFIMK